MTTTSDNARPDEAAGAPAGTSGPAQPAATRLTPRHRMILAIVLIADVPVTSAAASR
jgi:hypothetical protein